MAKGKVVPINVGQLQLAFAECRALGHEWRKGHPLGMDDTHDSIRRPYSMATGAIGIPSHCGNCGGDKVKWITRSGVSQNVYDMPDGYARHGEEVISAREWRSGYIETIFSQFEEAIKQPAKRGRGAS